MLDTRQNRNATSTNHWRGRHDAEQSVATRPRPLNARRKTWVATKSHHFEHGLRPRHATTLRTSRTLPVFVFF